MKVGKIIPCVCSPNWEEKHIESGYYGMPILRTYGGADGYFECVCPNCGRGGMIQFKSAYLALRDWNMMQEHLRVNDIFVFPEDKT